MAGCQKPLPYVIPLLDFEGMSTGTVGMAARRARHGDPMIGGKPDV